MHIHVKRIGILITGKCNLNCLHCLQDRNNSGFLGLALINKILQESKEIHIEHVVLSGGEPTMHPHILPIIKVIRDLGFYYSINTNGQNLEALLKISEITPPTYVTISLDGNDQDSHDKMRGLGTFDNAVQTIRTMTALGIKTQIQSVLSKKMVSNMLEMAELALQLDVNSLVFAIPLPTGRLLKMNLFPSIDEIQKAAFKVAFIEQKYTNRLRVNLYGCLPKNGSASLLNNCNNLMMKELSVDWHGNLVLCCQLVGYGQNNNEVIGDLTTESLKNRCLSLMEHIYIMRAHLSRETIKRRSDYPLICLRCVRALGKRQWL